MTGAGQGERRAAAAGPLRHCRPSAHQSGQPVRVTISTGLFGPRESFAPLYGSEADGEELWLAVTKDMVKDAPGIDAGLRRDDR